MASALIFTLWASFVACVITLFVVSTKLIYRLREHYPDIYVGVGRPSALSRSLSFLWRLKPYENQLSPEDIKLLRWNLALVYICTVAVVLFVAFVVSHGIASPTAVRK